MVQRLRPAVETEELDRAIDGMSMSRLDKFGTKYDRWAKKNRRDARATWKIISMISAAMGQKLKYNLAEEVFNDIAQWVDAFKKLDYDVIGELGAKLKMEVTETI